MQAKAETEQAVPTGRKMSIVLMTLVALAMGYVVIKDVVIPTWMMAVAAILGGSVLLAMGVNRPEIVTYVLVAYLPFSKVLAGDFGGLALAFNLTNLLMLFIFAVWMSGRYSKDDPFWLSTPLNFPILLFAGLGFMAVARGNYYGSDHAWIAFVEFKRWITPVLMYFLVVNTVRDRRTIRNIVIIIIAVTTIVGLMAIYEYIDVGETSFERSRIGGISEHSNSLAAFFCYYIFLPIGFLQMNMSRFKYWALVIPILIQFRGIMVTFSRGGYIAFAFGLYCITFFRSKILTMFLIALTVVMFMNPILLPAGIRYRLGQTFQSQVSYVDTREEVEGALDTSAHSRIEIWRGAIKMIEDHPFFGVGYGLFMPMIAYYWSQARPIDAHNTYLIIAAEMGIPTLLVFLWIVFQVMLGTYFVYRHSTDPFAKALGLGFLGGLFGLLMSNMFGSRLDSQEVSSYFWILSALIMRIRFLNQKENKLNIPVGKKLDGGWSQERAAQA